MHILPHEMTDTQLIMYSLYMLLQSKTHVPNALSDQLYKRSKESENDG